jgi:soluble lytic murein transglycosylase-like protein
LAASESQRQFAESIAKMQAGLDKQRESVERQMRAVGNTQPFVPAPASGATSVTDCERLPEDEIRRLATEAAEQEAVDPLLVHAMIRRESGGKPCAVSAKGAQGLMQLMPATQSDLGVRDPFEPAENVKAGVRYLKQLLEKYDSDVRLALAAYNAGPQRVTPGGGIPAIPETQAYVTAILDELKKPARVE